MDYNYINELDTPAIQPPPIVFKIVWPILYILMFWSFYIFLKAEPNRFKLAGFWLFIIQLALNCMWSPVFFYYKKIRLALVISVLLTIVTGLMIFCFYKADKLAGFLNVPYFVWLIFADYLNYKICTLNRDKCIF